MGAFRLRCKADIRGERNKWKEVAEEQLQTIAQFRESLSQADRSPYARAVGVRRATPSKTALLQHPC